MKARSNSIYRDQEFTGEQFGVEFGNVNNIKFYNCKFFGNQWGAYRKGKVKDIEFHDCEFYDNQLDGLSMWMERRITKSGKILFIKRGQGITLINCRAYRNGRFGILGQVDILTIDKTHAYDNGRIGRTNGINNLTINFDGMMINSNNANITNSYTCLLYTSPSPRDQRGSRMPSSA